MEKFARIFLIIMAVAIVVISTINGAVSGYTGGLNDLNQYFESSLVLGFIGAGIGLVAGLILAAIAYYGLRLLLQSPFGILVVIGIVVFIFLLLRAGFTLLFQ